MKKKILFIVALFFVQISFSQHKSRADRFFEKGDYITAAKYYEKDLTYKQHKKDLARIAVCYYNIFEYREAAYNLKDLVNGRFVDKDKTYDNSYNFKLYQVLSALGDYEQGLDYLVLYYKNKGITLNKDEAVANIEEIKLKIPDYEVKKTHFNSDASDFGAVKFADSVYFTSDRQKQKKKLFAKNYKWTHQSFLDIYAVKTTAELDTLSEIKALPAHLNSKLHEGNFCFSKDGKTIYVSKSNNAKGKEKFDSINTNNIHLYKATKTNDIWSNLEKLPFNTLGDSYQHPALSPDAKKLYFSSDRAGGFGDFDLYFVEINENTYGKPVNLGAVINTPNREHFPFISDKGNLFFSSNGHLGLGMLDNFVSEKIDNVYTTPINLGIPINSRYDDFNLNYYEENKGFFASNRSKINDDIYSFTQIGEIFPRAYTCIFEVRDRQTKELIPNATVVLKDKKGKEIFAKTLSVHFTLDLFPGKHDFSANANEYLPRTLSVLVLEEKDQKHILYLNKKKSPKAVVKKEVIVPKKPKPVLQKPIEPKRLELLEDKEGPAVVERNGKLYFDLEPIYFDFDMWNIRADSKIILDELAKKLERYPNIYIKINSHTDSRGTTAYNQTLSHRRAEATRNYLALEGYINARRMKFEGFGELKPIIPCESNDCTEEDHQLNRRSEFEIIKY